MNQHLHQQNLSHSLTRYLSLSFHSLSLSLSTLLASPWRSSPHEEPGDPLAENKTTEEKICADSEQVSSEQFQLGGSSGPPQTGWEDLSKSPLAPPKKLWRPPKKGQEDLSKNALGWEDLSKIAFFKLGLTTSIIKRIRSRASIWYRFHRKWCKL